jgi:putative spermidine/putrescine transport system substrate-binding protein
VPNAGDVPAVALPYDGAWLTYSTPRIACSYSTKALPGGLPSWASLWEPRFNGKLSLPSMSLTSTPPLLAIAASIATGKPPAEAQYDVDAGFKKLAELKPNIIGIHTSGQQAQTLLEQGAVWVIPADIGSYVLRRKAEGLPFDFNKPSEGSFGLPAGAALVKGGANRELAELFIGELLDLRVQSALVKGLSVVPSNPNVAPGPDDVPLAQLLTTDWEFVAKNRAAWMDRFDREIAN